MGNFIIISVFAKLSDPEETFVEANKTVVSINSETFKHSMNLDLKR